MVRLLPIAGLLVLAVCVVWRPAQVRADPVLAVENVTIETGQGSVTIRAEIADTPESRRLGLMFRRELDWKAGMLFDFGRVQPVSFWMKDTPLSLDLLFIDEAGFITGIEAEAEPLSETPRPSPGPVLAVLELRGGAARRFGITVGNKVRHRLFEH